MNIGQPVWTSFGSLLKGVILSIHSSPDYVIVEYPDGERRTCTSSFLHETRESAKRACEEHAEYWQRQVERLDEEPDQYGNTESDFKYCCFPDCGCDGARLCMAPSGPNSCAMALNLEKGYFKRQREKLLRGEK